MNNLDLQHWDSIKLDLKNRYPQLTNADLIWRHETKDDFFKMISAKLEITKRELAAVVDSF